VAAAVGIPANLVRVRLHRARARVADRLASSSARSSKTETLMVEHER
jgi:DNA-directed RNA polymerase specialized sigma24 family protein